MDSSDEITYKPARFPHPGELLVDYLEDEGWSQRDLARRSGLTPKTISEICNGKAPVTPSTALVFEKIFQRPAHFWLSMQSRYDEAAARSVAEVSAEGWGPWARKFPLSELSTWAKKFPLKEMKRYQWIAQSNSDETEVEALLKFLGVSSPDSWNQVWNAAQVSYRQTHKFKTSVEAIAVWSRAAELMAAELAVRDYDEVLLRSSIDQLRRATRKSVPDAVPDVQRICADAGIAVVWAPELKQTGISGCARWLNQRKALIALTLRYKTDDQMWFTFFHELGHLLLHSKTLNFVVDNAAESLTDKVIDPQMQKIEEEANRFAADTLIPSDALSAFVLGKDFGNDAIKAFAEEIGVGPGLVVGRLQHDGLLQSHQGNAFKQRLSWQIVS